MKQHLKWFVAGVMVGAIGLTTAFAAGSIKTATFNDNQVIYNGQALTLSQPMVSVVKEGEKNVSNYMPVRAVLEAMGYTVDWDSSRNAVIINGDNKETTVDPKTEEKLKEFDDFMALQLQENPQIGQAVEQLKNSSDYEAANLMASRLEPAIMWIIMAEDYQVWLTDGECLFPKVWETLVQQ